MAKNLQAGLRQSIKASRKAGVTGAGIFSLAPLDLRFALQKTLDPRVTFTRASTGTYVGSDGLIATAATDAPRFDHNPTTGESLGLLVEEARTNSVTNNTMVGAVAGTPGTNPTGWIYATTQSNGLTISIVGTGVENGINYIDYRFNGTTVASPNACAMAFTNATAATAQTWTSSTYWKLAAGSTTGTTNWQLGLIESTAVGVFITGAFYSQTAPTSAALITQRPTATRTLSGGATVGLISYPLNISVAGNTAIDFTIRIGLPQLEQGAFATSVIPTTTATVTRAADVASITGSNFSSFYNQTEGTVFAAGVSNGANGSGFFTLEDGSAAEYIRMGVGFSLLNFIVSKASGTQSDIYSTGTSFVFGSPFGGVAAYAFNNVGLSLNGGSAVVDTTANMPSAVNALQIGFGKYSNYANGTIKRLTYWPVRLADPTLVSITQP